MSIERSKNLRRNICKTVGHSWEAYETITSGGRVGGNLCSRCKRREQLWERVNVSVWPITTKPKVKYSDLEVRRFDLYDRMKKRVEEG